MKLAYLRHLSIRVLHFVIPFVCARPACSRLDREIAPSNTPAFQVFSMSKVTPRSLSLSIVGIDVFDLERDRGSVA